MDAAGTGSTPFDSTAFGRQVAVQRVPDAERRYRADLTADWNASVLPQGGVTTALAVRAMATELGVDTGTLRSVTSVFVAQVPPGPVDIDVGILRCGRTMSHATATVAPSGADAGHTALAVFGDVRAGFRFTDMTMPVAPPPDACPSFRDPPPDGVTFDRSPFWDHVEGRVAIGHAPFEDWEPTTSERVYWYRFDEPPFDERGAWDPLALVAVCDTMPGSVRERMGPDMPTWYGPSADLTVHVVGRARAEWLMAHCRVHRAGGGYASAQMALWDPERGLVAFATQMMFFSFPEGPPPPERLRPPGGP